MYGCSDDSCFTKSTLVFYPLHITSTKTKQIYSLISVQSSATVFNLLVWYIWLVSICFLFYSSLSVDSILLHWFYFFSLALGVCLGHFLKLARVMERWRRIILGVWTLQQSVYDEICIWLHFSVSILLRCSLNLGVFTELRSSVFGMDSFLMLTAGEWLIPFPSRVSNHIHVWCCTNLVDIVLLH